MEYLTGSKSISSPGHFLSANGATVRTSSSYDEQGRADSFRRDQEQFPPLGQNIGAESCFGAADQVTKQGASCQCSSFGDDTVHLECIDACPYCTDDGLSCANSTFALNISTTHFHLSEARFVFEYDGEDGRSESVELFHMDCYGYLEDACDCEVFVDGTKCDSCSICGNSIETIGFGYKIDCENYAPGSSIDSCEAPVGKGPLQVIDYQIENCMQQHSDYEDLDYNETSSLGDLVLEASNKLCTSARHIHDPFSGPIYGNTSLTPSVTSPCDEFEEGSGVWYTFIGSGRYVDISACSPLHDFDATLILAHGDCYSLQCLATSPFTGRFGCPFTPFDSTMIVPIQEGEEYTLFVQNMKDSDLGEFELRFNPIEVPPNDEFSNATKVALDDSVIGRTIVATPSAVSECGWGDENSADVWYEIDGSDEAIDASTCGTEPDFDTRIAVYRRTDLSGELSCVAMNDDFCGLGSKVTWFASSDSSYLIRVYGFASQAGTFELQVGADLMNDGQNYVELPVSTPMPGLDLGTDHHSNDECIDATILDNANDDETFWGDTSVASISYSMEGACGSARWIPSNGVWYTVQGEGQTITVSTCSPETTFDTQLSVSSGSCGDLHCVDGNDDGNACPNFGSTVTFFALQGQKYFIHLFGFSGASGIFKFSKTSHRNTGTGESPANDFCVGAVETFVGETTVGDTGNGATDSEAASCTESNASPDLWYKIVGTGEFLKADTCSFATAFDTQLSVYEGSCHTLKCLDDNDDACGTSSVVSWLAEMGVVYFIRVHGFGFNFGAFKLHVSLDRKHPTRSDTCAEAIFLEFDQQVVGSTINAKPDPLLQGCGTSTPVTTNSVWYYAVGDGRDLVATTCHKQTDFNTQISIFIGDCAEGSALGFLTCIAGNDQACNGKSLVRWPTWPGEVYYILVHGYLSSAGTFSLHLYPVSPTAGEDDDYHYEEHWTDCDDPLDCPPY